MFKIIILIGTIFIFLKILFSPVELTKKVKDARFGNGEREIKEKAGFFSRFFSASFFALLFLGISFAIGFSLGWIETEPIEKENLEINQTVNE
jgi:hypothetical protein